MLVEMTSTPRNANRMSDGRLWDETGAEWMLTASDLTIVEVEAALADETVRVALHHDWGRPVEWVLRSDRQRTWTQDIGSNFADGGIRLRGKRTRGPMPYVASLWALGEGRVLLFDRD
jgi:hypothetical protein